MGESLGHMTEFRSDDSQPMGLTKIGKSAGSNQPMKIMLSAEYFTLWYYSQKAIYISQRGIKMAHKIECLNLPTDFESTNKCTKVFKPTSQEFLERHKNLVGVLFY